MGFHFKSDDEPSETTSIPEMKPHVWAQAITSASDVQLKALSQIVLEEKPESLMVQLLRHPVSRIQDFAADALWNIWHHERGEEAYQELNMGLEALKNKQYRQALQLFQNTMVRYPGWAEPINKTATTLYMMGSAKDSLGFCKEVVRLKPHHFGAWSGMILCAIQLEEWEVAREALKHYWRLQPGSEDAREFARILESKS